MKIAILSDIHGDITALDTVLADAKKEKIDVYLVAGDNITDFPDSDAVLDCVKKLTPYVIKGNREEYILEYLNTKTLEKWKCLQLLPFCYIGEHIRKDNVEYIKTLPENRSITLDGMKIKMVHGSPFRINEHMFVNRGQDLTRFVQDLKEDILICGHTHESADYEMVNGKLIINAGVVGGYSTKSSTEYVVLEKVKDTIHVKMKQLPVDMEKLKQRLLNSQIVKSAYVWTNLSYLNAMRHENVIKEFVKKCEACVAKKEVNNNSLALQHFKQFTDEVYKEVVKEYEQQFYL